jgi:hypothetical protein
MQAINLERTADQFLISIDKNLITKEMLLRMLNQFRLEFLAQQSDFDERFEVFGEKIKDSW